jgi:hypothetical protein
MTLWIECMHMKNQGGVVRNEPPPIGPIMFIAVIMALGLGLSHQQQIQLAYGCPTGPTEADKDKLMSARSIDDVTLEQYRMAIDRTDEIFNYFILDKEYTDLLDFGYVDREPFEALQYWEGKGYTVR